MNPSYPEKRRFIRHPIHTPITLQFPDRKRSLTSKAGDLSLGGLSFLWKQRLSKGEVMNITIPIKDKLFNLNAKVVFSKENPRTGDFRTGVCFLDRPSAFRAKLAEEALEILEYRKTISQKLGHDVSEEEAARKWIERRAANFPN